MIGLDDLAWYPKPFGPGDIDGTGETKVLGRPEVALLDLLVRETSQNSWDARLPGVVPRFELRMRQLDDRVRDVLEWNVFRQRVPESDLDRALQSPVLRALEIVDRGTKGLGGPTRNDSVRRPGEPRDYADFVLTIGAPPDDLLGGGSYGFGKTASYMASACSTIIIWSRSRLANGRLIERLVASAMGPAFEWRGRRYTGRQWWGAQQDPLNPGEGLSFDPVEGEAARRLGEAVFERHFTDDETGTSILVLAPEAFEGNGEPTKIGSQPLPQPPAAGPVQAPVWGTSVPTALAQSVVLNLWPKLDPCEAAEWRMDVAVFSQGVLVPLPGPASSPLLTALKSCLNSVRDVQAGQDPSDLGIEVLPTARYGSVTGHLAITRVFGGGSEDPLAEIADHVSLMRNRAELVVCYQPYSGNSMVSLRWVAVFKPIEQLDPVFSAAEPPAHDSWSHVEVLDRRTRSIIKVTMREIRDAVRRFLLPENPSVEADLLSTGALSAALAGLAAGVNGGASSPTPRASGRARAGGAAGRPRIQVHSVEPLPRDAADHAQGRQRCAISVSVVAGQGDWVLDLDSLSLAVDGGTMRSDGEVRLESWVGGRGHGDAVLVRAGEEVRAEVSYPAGVAISFDFRVGAG